MQRPDSITAAATGGLWLDTGLATPPAAAISGGHLSQASMGDADRYGRGCTHPDYKLRPGVADVLVSSAGEVDWRLADDTLAHAFVACARQVSHPKLTVVYEVMAHSDRQRCFKVVRRFSDFVALGADMKRELFSLPNLVTKLSDVPRSGLLSFLSAETDPQSAFIKERQHQLETYLKEVIGIGIFDKSRSFRRFMLDRVYAHDWTQPVDDGLRSGVLIEASAFMSAAYARGDGQQGTGHSIAAEHDGPASTRLLSAAELRRRREAEEEQLAAVAQHEAATTAATTAAAAVRQAQRSGVRHHHHHHHCVTRAPASSAAAHSRENADSKASQARHDRQQRRRRRQEAKSARERARVQARAPSSVVDNPTQRPPRPASGGKPTAAAERGGGGHGEETRHRGPALARQKSAPAPVPAESAALHARTSSYKRHAQQQPASRGASCFPEPGATTAVRRSNGAGPQLAPEPEPSKLSAVRAGHIVEGGAAGAGSAGSGAPSAATPSVAQRKAWQAAEQEWEPQVDPASGRTYYINRKLNQSSWERPVYDPAVIARQEARLSSHRQATAAAMALEQASLAATADVEAEVQRWATTPFRKGLRNMLATLPEIWQAATEEDFPASIVRSAEFGDVAVKKKYLRALRLVHPDKVAPDSSVRCRVLSQQLFGLLSCAFREELG
jgi:hypothetical protein